MLYDIPLIDEHNKSRQNLLALKKQWLTKNCWSRILTTFLGMSLVDIHRWNRYHRSCKTSLAMFLDNSDNDFGIKKMTNLVAKPLRSAKLKFGTCPQPSRPNDGMLQLTYLQDKDSTINYDTCKPRNMGCFICRRYLQKTQCTQWLCKECGMPLCKMDRNHGQTCLAKHLSSRDTILGCSFTPRIAFLHARLPCYIQEEKEYGGVEGAWLFSFPVWGFNPPSYEETIKVLPA